jgi:hypothetical protein
MSRMSKRVTPRRLNICLAIPTSSGTLRVETFLSVVGILNATPHNFYVEQRTGCYIEENRTELIKNAIREGCEKIFFLDADMVVEHNVVNKLLALDKPVVGADYHMRGLPLVSNVKIAKDGKIISVEAKDIPKEPFQAYGVPTGCMLIDIAIVKTLPQPWFDLTWKEDGSLNHGEDIFFCKLLHDHGIEVWCDPTIEIGHIGTYVY